jgi:hypothetical protein
MTSIGRLCWMLTALSIIADEDATAVFAPVSMIHDRFWFFVAMVALKHNH